MQCLEEGIGSLGNWSYMQFHVNLPVGAGKEPGLSARAARLLASELTPQPLSWVFNSAGHRSSMFFRTDGYFYFVVINMENGALCSYKERYLGPFQKLLKIYPNSQTKII